MKNKTAQYRQGDVMIERIDKLPTGLKKQDAENGRVILAHGEVTGHAHSFAANRATKLVAENGAEFFRVKGEEIKTKLPIVRQWKNQVMVNHPVLGMIEFAIADVEIDGGEVEIDGEFGLLRHDEHSTHAVPAGLYRGAGATGTVRQREYTPEAIRNVAD
jgi:hypothetical protein